MAVTTDISQQEENGKFHLNQIRTNSIWSYVYRETNFPNSIPFFGLLITSGFQF